LKFSSDSKQQILFLVDGYTQYLQFALTYLHENKSKSVSTELIDELLRDERVALQSEELWESLTPEEQEVLIKFLRKGKIINEEKDKASYLWNTGIINEKTIFSPLFEKYVEQKGKTHNDSHKKELSKKENLLLKLLENNRGALCEREMIIENVWPEAQSYGVSDWAVDRLVARLRQKLKVLNPDYEIITVKTRGYKLI